jgi:hypothetical protein
MEQQAPSKVTDPLLFGASKEHLISTTSSSRSSNFKAFFFPFVATVAYCWRLVDAVLLSILIPSQFIFKMP